MLCCALRRTAAVCEAGSRVSSGSQRLQAPLAPSWVRSPPPGRMATGTDASPHHAQAGVLRWRRRCLQGACAQTRMAATGGRLSGLARVQGPMRPCSPRNPPLPLRHGMLLTGEEALEGGVLLLFGGGGVESRGRKTEARQQRRVKRRAKTAAERSTPPRTRGPGREGCGVRGKRAPQRTCFLWPWPCRPCWPALVAWRSSPPSMPCTRERGREGRNHLNVQAPCVWHHPGRRRPCGTPTRARRGRRTCCCEKRPVRSVRGRLLASCCHEAGPPGCWSASLPHFPLLLAPPALAAPPPPLPPSARSVLSWPVSGSTFSRSMMPQAEEEEVPANIVVALSLRGGGGAGDAYGCVWEWVLWRCASAGWGGAMNGVRSNNRATLALACVRVPVQRRSPRN